MQERIYLIGFMGAGKSTVGKKLARALNYRFLDLDDYFEEHYKIDIQAFFEKYGEELFRDLEHERLLKTFDVKGVVVATGGGTPCYHESMEEINQHGVSIYLEMNPAAIASRLSQAARKRPLIHGKSGENLVEYIEKKLEERLPFYKKAHFIVDGLDADVDELVKLLKNQ